MLLFTFPLRRDHEPGVQLPDELHQPRWWQHRSSTGTCRHFCCSLWNVECSRYFPWALSVSMEESSLGAVHGGSCVHAGVRAVHGSHICWHPQFVYIKAPGAYPRPRGPFAKWKSVGNIKTSWTGCGCTNRCVQIVSAAPWAGWPNTLRGDAKPVRRCATTEVEPRGNHSQCRVSCLCVGTDGRRVLLLLGVPSLVCSASSWLSC